MGSTFLEPEEIVELTHRTRCDAQVRALRFMGIEHRVRPDNTVAVLRAHMEKVFGGGGLAARAKEEIEPNWDAI